jgi:hypothetical protein
MNAICVVPTKYSLFSLVFLKIICTELIKSYLTMLFNSIVSVASDGLSL